MIFPRIDIHTHSSPASSGEEEEILLYNLPFPEKKGEALFPGHPGKNLFFSAGLHPSLSHLTLEEESHAFCHLENLLASGKLSAIGECGLDRNSPLSGERQMERFRQQILLSEKYSLPLILHNVHMWEEVFFLRKELSAGMPWIAHSFRGSPQLAKDLEKKGIYISFAPVFVEKSVQLKEYTSLSCVFLETDESKFTLSHLYRLLAEKWEMPQDELLEKINRSFKEVFYGGR